MIRLQEKLDKTNEDANQEVGLLLDEYDMMKQSLDAALLALKADPNNRDLASVKEREFKENKHKLGRCVTGTEERLAKLETKRKSLWQEMHSTIEKIKAQPSAKTEKRVLVLVEKVQRENSDDDETRRLTKEALKVDQGEVEQKGHALLQQCRLVRSN